MFKGYKIVFLFFVVVGFGLLVGCSENKSSTNLLDTVNQMRSTQATMEEVDYFSNLIIADVTFKEDIGGWIRIMGTIKNNNNVTVDGYIEVVFFDDNNSIVDTSLIRLPLGGLKAGESTVFSKAVTKEKFASYKFYNSALIKG